MRKTAWASVPFNVCTSWRGLLHVPLGSAGRTMPLRICAAWIIDDYRAGCDRVANDTIRRTDYTLKWWDEEDRIAADLMSVDALGNGRDSYREHRPCRLGSSAGRRVYKLARDGLADAGLVKALPDLQRSRFAAPLAGRRASIAIVRCTGPAVPGGRWPLGVYGNVFYVFRPGRSPANSTRILPAFRLV